MFLTTFDAGLRSLSAHWKKLPHNSRLAIFNGADKPKAQVPEEVDGIQVNFCKSPLCENYGVPAIPDPPHYSRAAVAHNPYLIRTTQTGYPLLFCCKCRQTFPMKSNRGIAEEVERVSATLPKPITCPDLACSNHKVPLGTKRQYRGAGRTAAGTKRYLCMACGGTFTPGGKRSGREQESTAKNRYIFQHLVNKVPFRRICELADISRDMLFSRIDHIHRQCMAFASDREAKLQSLPIQRLYLATDCQFYSVNWADSKVRRNVILKAVCSTENRSGYVFALHLNYDPEIDSADVERNASAIHDASKPGPFRKYAHLWLTKDYEAAIARRKAKQRKKGRAQDLEDEIKQTYRATLKRIDIEALDERNLGDQLPARGMQTHLEYLLYAHFLTLKKMVKNVGKWRFFLDQDPGIRAACLAAFQPEIKARTADAFFVRISKGLTIDKKKKRTNAAKKIFDAFRAQYPNESEAQIVTRMIKLNMATGKVLGPFKDKWVSHPLPTRSEPEKAVCCLTDHGDYDESHTAHLINRASLHSTDSFFNQMRRRTSILERAVRSSANLGRIWNAYGAYNPKRVAQILDIFRVVHNYVLVSNDDRYSAGSPLFSEDEISDIAMLVEKLTGQADPVSAFLWQEFSTQPRSVLKSPKATDEEKEAAVIDGINTVLKAGRLIHTNTRFAKIPLPPAIITLLAKKPTGGKLVRLNRLLLEAAYPKELTAIHHETTPAMRMGLARSPIDYKTILYFKG